MAAATDTEAPPARSSGRWPLSTWTFQGDVAAVIAAHESKQPATPAKDRAQAASDTSPKQPEGKPEQR